MSNPLHILVIKTSSMGDILHTLPALSDAATVFPEIKIDWVVEEAFCEIPQWHPNITTVLPVALRRWRKSWWRHETRTEYRQFIEQLQNTHYDCIIDAQGLFKSAFFIARHAKGIKHGYDRKSVREPLATLFYDTTHSISKTQHAVERTRALFAQALHYPTPTKKGEYNIASHFALNSPQLSHPYWIFLHATTRENKHWPENHWRKLIALLADNQIAIKLPWGTAQEKARAQRLAHDMPHVTVLPKSSLSELAQLLCDAQGVVSVDTGLSHLTAALDKPNLTLFGPTNPELIGGYGKQQYSLCGEQHQMSQISPETVLHHMQRIIQPVNKTT